VTVSSSGSRIALFTDESSGAIFHAPNTKAKCFINLRREKSIGLFKKASVFLKKHRCLSRGALGYLFMAGPNQLKAHCPRASLNQGR
jgi:hypothetical protein